jgi:hypothetical protein
MKKYTQESKLSLGNLKNSSKQTGVLDLKPTGIVHSIGYQQLNPSQSESTVTSDYMQNIINDSNKAYKNSQIQIGIKTGDDMAFINKTHNIRSRIEEIDDRLKEVGINKTEKRSLDDMKSELVKELEKLEISQEDPEMIKKLSIQVQELCNALNQSELQKQELIEHATTLQSENQNLQNVCQMTAQILPGLQASHQMIPELQAQIEDQKIKLKEKGIFKGDIRMVKLGITKGWPEDEIKELLVKSDKFEDIKKHFEDHPDRLDLDAGYESTDIEMLGEI